MVFGLPDQDLVPLLDRLWDHFRALPRSGWLRNCRWRLGYIALEVGESPVCRRFVGSSRHSGASPFSAADFRVLIPVATSWLSIAVFTDG